MGRKFTSFTVRTDDAGRAYLAYEKGGRRAPENYRVRRATVYGRDGRKIGQLDTYSAITLEDQKQRSFMANNDFETRRMLMTDMERSKLNFSRVLKNTFDANEGEDILLTKGEMKSLYDRMAKATTKDEMTELWDEIWERRQEHGWERGMGSV